MSITVKEKEYWSKRLSSTMERVAEKYLASKNPTLLDDISREARIRAVASLGIAELQQELGMLDEESAHRDEKRRVAQRKRIARIRGVDVHEVTDMHGYGYAGDQEVEKAIEKRQSRFEAELIEETEIGKGIVRLEETKAQLLDAVWMATSAKQVKELWATVGEVVEQLFAEPKSGQETPVEATEAKHVDLIVPSNSGGLSQ